MGKKKNKIAKLTDEQYYAYIAGLKNDAALADKDGNALAHAPFDANDKENEKNK